MVFPFVRQYDAMDCGPACLKMVAAYYNKSFALDSLRKKCYITKDGVSFLGLSEAADSLGFRTLGVKITFNMLQDNVPLPCIVHWQQKHFIVVYKLKNEKVHVADPAIGNIKINKEEFIKNWASASIDGQQVGLALIIEPTPTFFNNENDIEKYGGFRFLLRHFNLYKKYVSKLALGLFIGSCIQLTMPFLTQSIVDIGINNNNLGFIYVVLLAQLMLVFGRLSVEFIRGWLLLHIGSRVNVAIISGFLQKLMSLPIAFYDTKLTGDILQRIEDNKRIEEFLTTTSLSILFSFFNIFVFSVVLAFFSLKILLFFILGTFLYVLWISLFSNKRANLDHQRFRLMSQSGNKLINIVNGMQEIKLTQSETTMRWDWENLQASLFELKVKALSIIQYQTAGATLIYEITNIIITIISATAVLNGEMTLGMMLAVQFIIGQMNVPANQIINFFKMSQDTKISLDRLSEVHDQPTEEPEPENKIWRLPDYHSIYVNNLSFQYEGPRSPFALRNIDLVIEKNKTTALVGLSGSGKTTLLKMLLGFYSPTEGQILIGNTPLSHISIKTWRDRVGAVLQDGYLFPGTIAFNIAPMEYDIEEQKLVASASTANIKSFIETLPSGYNTRIGHNGNGLSEGQKQRILIARMIYKNPEIVLFDEATNSLDSVNEKVIIENLGTFFRNKTVVIAAHRLSTVKYADKIIVLDNGRIVESGDHNSLIQKKSSYYELIKNQLELGH
ncbi:MAG TPA: peptidase domain-containing ABC transporter [Bacteroidales bacterium]|nr:peptidase domain-containing ABC transporter [Bacteroidales bacterium]